MTDTLLDQLLTERRRSTIEALRNDSVAEARERLAEDDHDGALAVLERAAYLIARLEQSA
jgi:hypothetical protein